MDHLAIAALEAQAAADAEPVTFTPPPSPPDAIVMEKPPISGYRALSQAELELMNRIKALGTEVEALCSEVYDLVTSDDRKTERANAVDGEPETVHMDHMGHRWLDIAIPTLQTGLMQLTRAVARPLHF